MVTRNSAFVLAIAVTLSFAAARPDFTGVWAMNMTRSTLGENYPAPKQRTSTIEHNEPNLKIAVHEVGREREVRQTVSVTTDGKESTNDVLGNKMKATAVWEGYTLVVTTWGEFNGTPIKLIDRWSMAKDGKTLTILRRFEGGGRSAGQTLVYEKTK